MQELLVGIIVAVAIGKVSWDLYRQLTDKKECNCADGKCRCDRKPKRTNRDHTE